MSGEINHTPIELSDGSDLAVQAHAQPQSDGFCRSGDVLCCHRHQPAMDCHSCQCRAQLHRHMDWGVALLLWSTGYLGNLAVIKIVGLTGALGGTGWLIYFPANRKRNASCSSV